MSEGRQPITSVNRHAEDSAYAARNATTLKRIASLKLDSDPLRTPDGRDVNEDFLADVPPKN